MEHNWYALWVKSRHEFIARDDLSGKGIETFLPSVMKTRQWGDRKKKVEFPLFPGYVFVSLDHSPHDFQRAVRARGTVGLVSLEPGFPTPVAREEVQSLMTMIASGLEFDVYPQFQTGARVRVRRGPLEGAAGILAKKEEQHYFFINVEILGRSVGLRICASDIEQA